MAIQQDDKLFNRWPFDGGEVLPMGLSKTEINLRRLLDAAPRQKNQTKLIHYVTTLREQLEQLGAETTPQGAPSIPKAKLNEYSERIEALAAKLAAPLAEHEEATHEAKEEGPSSTEQTVNYTSSLPGLRRRPTAKMETKESSHDAKEKDSAMPVKLDASALDHIEKHRKLQEDLTDDLVALARQLKEGSLLINRSVQDTEKILDSTENAVEHSLASTSRASKRAIEVYSESFKTTCFTWLVIFIMICVFIMVVLLIRIT
ncbi:unnamed protein product [Musa acuminata subsp. malaccensis]|uniref:(wild Malaysian banana) hypothetical protein n=1 Tax=Musa acuminata subsp. malaccensis TaxID=214687 RepID=A0A804K4H6_MUSAM|nr:PREDICTED: uncharacterized protein LOC103993449 [Musa acuminata subsp. malaccensis]CAG1830998.1 unnamed protein product [Musa acuminata subsp. malaccensis]